jgi:PAS domain S-box-containing protein
MASPQAGMSSKPRVNRSSQTVRYGTALLAVVLATLLRALLSGAFGPRLPFTTYFIAVIVIAIYCGLRPALVVMALGAVIGTYLFVLPFHPLNFSEATWVLQFFAFCVVSGGTSILVRYIQDARSRAENAAFELAESREQIATILASIGDAVIATDLDGNVTFINGVAQTLTGSTKAAAEGKHVNSIVEYLDEETQQPQSPVTRVLNEDSLRGSYKPALLICKDGKRIPIEDNSSSIKNASGKTTGVALVFRDVTERRQIEHSLREKEGRFRMMADTTPVMLWLSGTDGVCNFFNQSWLDFTGRTMEQEMGYGWADNVHPDDLRRCLDTYVNSLEARTPYNIEYQLRRSDGVYRWVLSSGVPRYTKEGEFIGFAGSCLDIADRKKAEEAFQSLASIVESSEDAIISKKLDGTVISWNAAAERIYGYSAEEAKGKHISILSPPDRLGELTEIFKTLSRGESITHLETVRRTKRGDLIDVALTISPTRDEEGHITGASTIARDITERKRAEQERLLLSAQVDKERQRLNNVVANVPGVVWEAWGQPDKTSQRIDFVSEYVQKMLGYTTDEWLSSPNFWLSIVHPDDSERAAREAASIFASGKGGTSRFRWIAKDGRTVWVEAQSVVVSDNSGSPVGMRGVTIDISERKRAEDAQRFLAEASGLLAGSLDYETTLSSVAKLAVPNLADWCMVHIIGDNGQLRQLAVVHTDAAKEEGARKLQQRHPIDPEGAIGVANVLRTGRSEFYPVISLEQLLMAARHEDVATALRGLDLKSCIIAPLVARNRTIGTITLATEESKRYYDLTDLAVAEDLAHRIALAVDNARLYREAQDAVTAREDALRIRDDLLKREHVAREQAESANRSKDEFLATVSHELRTPLNAILGWAHMLRSNKLDQSTHARALETIERNAKVQAQLIEDILDASRIVTGKLRLDVRPVELATVVDAAIDSVRPAAEAKGIQIETILDPAAGPVSGDVNRLQQIVWNLVSNAVKFTGKDGRVEVRLLRAPPNIEIVVSDTGQGISSEFLPYVFDRFRQADATSTRRHGGLGLGLAIVRHLVEMHGGTVVANSPGEEQGATFVVSLPMLVARGHTGELQRKAAAAGVSLEPTLRLDGVKVMVVDDEVDTREMLRIMIGQLGAEVKICASSTEAVRLFGEWKPDVIVSDIEMPGEDGYELIRKVRLAEKSNGNGNVSAVALTAYGRIEDRLRALAAGYQMHISKPAEPAELAAVIASLATR